MIKEAEPIKRYLIIQNMKSLRDKLLDKNLDTSDINIIIDFAPSISYESLLKLVSSYLSYIESKLLRRDDVASQS